MMLVAPGAQPGLTREQHREGLAANLSAACKYAEDKEITICIEDFPSTDIPMCAAKDIDYLLDHVDGLKLTYDSANMLVEGEKEQDYYEHFKDRIGYCHLKDVRMANESDTIGDVLRDGRKMVTTYHGEGMIDFPAVIGWFKRDGYQGYMSVEYAPDGDREDLFQILVDTRKYLENIMEEN